MIEKDTKELCEKLRSKGLSYAKISRELNIATPTVQYHLNKKYRLSALKRAKEWNEKNKEKYKANHNAYMKSDKGRFAVAKSWIRKYLRDGVVDVDDVLKIIDGVLLEKNDEKDLD